MFKIAEGMSQIEVQVTMVWKWMYILIVNDRICLALIATAVVSSIKMWNQAS